jgi:CheY-like chemotaxis protein
MLGHELRNPLAPMLTSLQVMRLEHEDSPALDILERQIRHLTRLVDDLLDISRITRGKLDLQHEDLDVITIVNRALEMSTPLLEQRGHRIVSELELRGLGVSGDADRLAQVVGNLLSNAAKYSDPGSEIRISARRIDVRVVLAVEDRGAGIAPEMLATVFDAFVQQPQTLARSQGGLGLGLAIVKNIVLAHGGVVSAHSEGLGRGSRFVVELPAIELRAPIEQPRRERTVRPRAMPLRILVVDDNREAADILQIALEALGHTIAIAYDGPSALEISATYEPQLALIDIGLPVMDGYRLAEALHRTYNIPIVAVTGYGQDSDRLRSREAGFAAHLVKPVDLHELAELANRLCSP